MTLEELKKVLEQYQLSKENPSCQVKYKSSNGEKNTYTIYFNPDSEKNVNLPNYFVVNLSKPLIKEKDKAVYNVRAFKKNSDGELEIDNDLTFYACEERGEFIFRQSFIKEVTLIKEKIKEALDAKKYAVLNNSIYTLNSTHKNFHVVCFYNAKLFNHEYFVIDFSRKAPGTEDFFIANKINSETGLIYIEEWAVKILSDGQYKFIQHVPMINVKEEFAQLTELAKTMEEPPCITVKGYDIIRHVVNEKPQYFAVKEHSSGTGNCAGPAFLVDEESGLIDQSNSWVDHSANIEKDFLIDTGIHKYILPSIRRDILNKAKQQGPAFATSPVIIRNETVHLICPDTKKQPYINTEDKFKLFEFVKENLFNPDLEKDTLSKALVHLSLEQRLQLALIVEHEKNFVANLKKDLEIFYTERKNLLLNLIKEDLSKVETSFFRPKVETKNIVKKKWDFFKIFSSKNKLPNEMSLEQQQSVASIINTIKIYIYNNDPTESDSIIRKFFSGASKQFFHKEHLSETAITLVTFLNGLKPAEEALAEETTPIPTY